MNRSTPEAPASRHPATVRNVTLGTASVRGTNGLAPPYIQDALALGQTLSTLGKAVFNGIRAYAEHNNIQIEGLPADPRPRSPEQALHIIPTSSPSSSPSCTRPPRDMAPQPDPGVRQP